MVLAAHRSRSDADLVREASRYQFDAVGAGSLRRTCQLQARLRCNVMREPSGHSQAEELRHSQVTRHTCETRDSAAAFASCSADGVAAVGWLLACPAAEPPRCGVEVLRAPLAGPEGTGLADGAKDVGAVLAASAAALTASGATGAPPTCASMGEPAGRAAAAALQHTNPRTDHGALL